MNDPKSLADVLRQFRENTAQVQNPNIFASAMKATKAASLSFRHFQELSESLRLVHQSIFPEFPSQVRILNKHWSDSNERLAKVLSEVYTNYQPINETLKVASATGPLLANQLKEMSEKLNSSLANLSAFHYDLTDFQEEKVEEEKVIKIVNPIEGLINKIYDDQKLLDVVDPRKFEEIIAELLHHRGFNVSLTKRTRDNGYDIIALNKIGGIPLKILVECKRQKSTVGIGIIRSFCDVIRHENANKGVFVTTSYFSKPSRQREEQIAPILDLKDRNDILDWMFDYQKK